MPVILPDAWPVGAGLVADRASSGIAPAADTEVRVVVGADRRGIPVAAVRNLRVSRVPWPITARLDDLITCGDGTVVLADTSTVWMLRPSGTEARTDSEWSGLQLGGRRPFIPTGVWRDEALAVATQRETIALLRSVLEERGAFRNTATMVPEVRLRVLDGTDPARVQGCSGLRIPRAAASRLLPLFELMPTAELAPGRPTWSLQLSSRLGAREAGRVRESLWSLTMSVRRLGVAVEDWSGLLFDPADGTVVLNEATPLRLLSTPILSEALVTPPPVFDSQAPAPWRGSGTAYSDYLPYLPNLATVASGESRLMAAEGLLQVAFRDPRFRSFEIELSAKALASAYENFCLFVRTTADRTLSDHLGPSAGLLETVVERHVRMLGWYGLVGYLTLLLPAVMKLHPPNRWLDVTEFHVRAARTACSANLEQYWADACRPLWNRLGRRQCRPGSSSDEMTPKSRDPGTPWRGGPTGLA